VCYLTARVWHEPISRYGVNAILPGWAGCTTSHGIVPSPRVVARVHEMFGVHRYKLVLLVVLTITTPHFV